MYYLLYTGTDLQHILGQADFPARPHALLLVCSTCGEIWGRIEERDTRAWDVDCRPCISHAPIGAQDWGKIPGSFLHSQLHESSLPVWAWPQSLEQVPLEVLKRELEVHIRNLERKVEEDE